MTTDVLSGAIGAYLVTDEVQNFFNRRKLQDEIRLLLSQHHASEARNHFNNILLKFMWEEITPSTLQAELQHLFTTNPSLQTPNLLAKLSPIFAASANTDAEQSYLKKAICDLFGLVTQKRDASRPSLEDGIRFQRDVEERFKSQPGKYQQFQNTGFGPWREDQPAEEARAQLVELLIGEEDLLERFEEIWPGNHGENGTGGIGA